MPGKHQLKPHVDQHLRKRKVDPDQLPASVVSVLNDCTPDELNAMDRVGEALEAEKVDTPTRVSMVH